MRPVGHGNTIKMKITRRQLRRIIREAAGDPQDEVNGELSSVILQGIKTVVGDDLSHPGESEEFLGEIRLILDNNPDVANKLYDVFMTIRSGGGFDNEWYEERHQDDQALGELDQVLDQIENEDPEDWPDEDLA